MPHPSQPTPDRQAAAASRETPASAASRDTKKPTDSVPVATGTFAALPARFGRYQVEKLLGRGMMGAVYLARDSQLDRLVALKIPRVSAAGSAKLLKRLEVEAKAAAKLHHPNICSVYDYGVLDDVHFIALQYVEGQDLKSWLKQRGRPLAPAAAIRLMSKLAGAVGEAHRQEIIHRDLKPENIMLKPDGEPVIMDFGLARRASGATDAGLTQGMIVGTALYMSPEQANGRAEGIDHRSDIYALGVMLFELLTGAWPFTGTAMEVMGQKTIQEPPTPLEVDATLPPQLAAVCHKMIARKKEDRCATCAEVVAALESIDLNAPATDCDAPLDGISLDFLAQEPAPMPVRRKSTKPTLNIPAALANLTAWWSTLPPVARWAALGGAGALSVALAVILFFQTPYGVLQIEIEDPTLSVKFDGQSITVDNDGQPIRVTATAEHTLEVQRDGATIAAATQQLTLKRGEQRLMSLSLIDGQVAINGVPINATRSNSSDFFNGRDLTGWQGLPGHWSVENGAIVGRCAAGQSAYTFLVSDKSYKDFDLKFEARRRGGDSSIGVQFRSWVADRGQFKVYGPQCDVATPSGRFPIGSLVTEPTARPLAEKAKPEAVATFRRNDFNRIRIRCIGKHATVWVNDVISVDGEFPLPDEGRIAWPIDGGAADHEIVIRNIELADLSEPPSTAGNAGGFVPLFNGKDFSGWDVNGRFDAFAIDSDRQTLVMKPSSPVSRLQTDRDYQDFHLRFEFRIALPTAQSGVNIRMPSRAEGILPALKVQITDDSFPYRLLTGGVYYAENVGIKRSRDDLLNGAGTWNRMEIIADGPQLQVSVNGKTCVDADLQQFAGQAIPAASRTTGRIAFNADLGEVWFRNIEIREKTDAKITMREPEQLGRLVDTPQLASAPPSTIEAKTNPATSAAPPEVPATPAPSVTTTAIAAPMSVIEQRQIPADAVASRNKRFKVYPEHLTWHAAKKKCEDLGGRLAEVRSAQENDFLAKLAVGRGLNGVWLGATDKVQEEQWLWSDGSKMTYKNWSDLGKQPNNGGVAANEHFLLMLLNRETGEWCDQADTAKESPVGYICEWDAPSARRTAATGNAAWEPVFNGKDLTGWTPMATTGKDLEIQTTTTGGWTVRNAELLCDTNTPGWLRLDKTYGECEIEFEFFLPPNTNSGLLVRYPGRGMLHGTNKCEIQLENDPSQKKPEQVCGAIYGVVAPSRNAFKHGLWNKMSVRSEAGELVVELNGLKVATARTSDHDALRGLPAAGYFGLFNFRGLAKGCKFRKIRIRELEPRSSVGGAVSTIGSGVSPALKDNAQRSTAGTSSTNIAKSFTTTASGLRYRILRKSAGQKPSADSTVTVHYKGSLDNGTVFDSSYDRGAPAVFPLNSVIRGWSEGLQLVGEEGSIELVVPPQLAYGDKGSPPAIPANSTLHFTIELFRVK